ncbi:MAG: ABC transporter ATP-binding protein [bacterium]
MSENNFAVPTEQPGLKDILKTMPLILKIALRASPGAALILFLVALSFAPLMAFYTYAIGALTFALTTGDTETAYLLTGGFLIYTAIQSTNFLLNTWFGELQTLSMRQSIDEELKLALLKMPAATLEDAGFQSLLTAYRRKMHVGQEFIGRLRYFANSLAGLFGVMTSFFIIPWLATVILGVALVAQWLLAKRAARKHWRQLVNDSREGRRMSYFDQGIENPDRLLRLRNISAEHGFFRSWKQLAVALMDRQRDSTRASSIAEAAYEVIEGFAFAIGLVLIVQAITSGESTIAVLMTFIVGFQAFAGKFHELNVHFNWLKQEGQFFVLHARLREVPVEQDFGETLPNSGIDIACSNVSFRYADDQPMILKCLNLTIKAGERIAIVGANGAGKSTLMKLISRVYKPTFGTVLANELDIWRIKPSVWQRMISTLMQKRFEHSDTVKKQVLYASQDNPEAPDRYTLAIETSQLGGVIKDLPKGEETFAGKWGAMPEDNAIELSGGQRQMLAIAQNLYKDSQVYVFDEPTSEMDPERTQAFFDALPKALPGKTIIYVSHHFATLRQAERILVLDHGEIVEDGSHEELMKKRGRYHELFTMQAKNYQ